jgi:DNA-binding IclR family transcriptional regulator
MKHEQIKEKILKTINQSSMSLSISDLSRSTKFHRLTIDRYVTLLEEEGKVKRESKPPMILISKVESD